MGIGPSTTRRISVRNEEARIIQVSEDVVKRLSSAGRSADTETQTEPQITRPYAPAERTITPDVLTQQWKSSQDFSSTSSQSIRQSNVTDEDVLAAERIFKQKLDELRKLAPKKKGDRCRDLTEKVAECYAAHPKQTLRCAETVREFAQCAYEPQLVPSS